MAQPSGCSPCSTSATATCCASTVPMFATTSLLALLGMKGSTVPGEEGDAAESSSRHQKLGRAIDLLADADLSLRGTKDGHRSWWSRCSSLGWPTSAVGGSGSLFQRAEMLSPVRRR